MSVDVDIVLPFYKPAPGWGERICPQMAALQEHFDGRCEVHFHIVNDGSEDSFFSGEEFEPLRRRLENLEFHSYKDNHGKGFCLRYGVRQCTGEYLVYTDSDFPFGWEAVAAMIEELLDGADVVMAQRGEDYTQALDWRRRFISAFMRFLNCRMLGIPLRYQDSQAGMKGFNRIGREIFLKTEIDTFLFDTEFIAYALFDRGHRDVRVLPVRLRAGMQFSRMGKCILLREFRHFLWLFWKCRFKRGE